MEMDHSKMGRENTNDLVCKKPCGVKYKRNMEGEMKMEWNLFSEYNYDYLRSPETNYSADAPVKKSC
jgi:hypothetical protein